MRTVLFFAALTLPAAALAQVQPGQWEIVTTVSALEMPGAPPFVAAMMKRKPIRISQCLTPEDAARGPQELMKANKECRFTRYSMKGGQLDSVMVCNQNGGTLTATSSGTMTPTGFTTNGRTVMTGAQAMTMSATSVGRRTGECQK